MILGTAFSFNDVEIRLTENIWEGVLDKHPDEFSYHDFEEVLDAVEEAEYVLRGHGGALIAVVEQGGAFLHVMYRELDADEGFVITAFYKHTFDRRRVIWRRYEDGR